MSAASLSLRVTPLVIAASLLASGLARSAPSNQEKAEAEALFQEGKKLMLQKRWAEACPKLEASQKLDPAGGTLFNLALCHEEEGKLATAWIEFTDALAQAKVDKKAERAKSAREHIDRLEPRLPKLIIKAAATPPGFKVLRDGALMSDASFGTPIPIDPGSHQIQASAPERLPYEMQFSIAAGELKTINIPALSPVAPPPASSSAAPVAPPPPPASGRKTAGYITGGVGVAALLVGGFFGVRTFSKKSDSDRDCPTPSSCTPAGVKANEDAYTSANIANIGIGLGVIGVGIGAYLVLSSRPSSPASASWGVSPAFAPGSGGLQAHGRF